MLHIIEAPDELAVRTLQGVVRIDMIKPSGIDDTEKEIAELIGGFLLVLLGQFCLQFAELFPHLVPYVLFLFPIEADIARLVLNAVSLDERRQASGTPPNTLLLPSFSFNLICSQFWLT